MSWKHHLHLTIFETETKAGRRFDLILIILICLSVLSVALESVSFIEEGYGKLLYVFEWILTIIFTIEYLSRVFFSKNTLKYVLSFVGIVDLLAVLPTYLSLILIGSHSLIVIRVLRLLRIFRILKLAKFVGEGRIIMEALAESRAKLTVFLGAIMNLVIILGTIMYLIEGGDNGFTSIPRSIYWAIVTLTTVGYGDIAPQTVLGQTIASVIMMLGYTIIAVPTGIVSTSLANTQRRKKENALKLCPSCGKAGHENDAKFCKHCGASL